MNWPQKKNQKQTNAAGYSIEPTTINGRARFCVRAPDNQVLGVPTTRTAAVELCETHQQEANQCQQS